MQANRGVTLILLSLMTRPGSPKDVLTLQPNWPLFFTGETVNLRCLGRPYKHHGFSWYRNESNSWVYKHTSHNNIYIITPVTEAHSGLYRCSAESTSDPVRLNVSALPKPTLTVQPKWRPLYNEETVTLRCEVDSDSNWIYFWYKDQAQMAVSQTAGHSVTGNRLTIPGAAGSDQGQYWCEGRLEGRKVTSQCSDSINLTIAALPKATLTVEPKWRPLYNGETVTLSCEVDSYSSWTYSWYKDQAQMAVSQTAGHSVTGNRLTIPGAAGSDQGQYWCEGRLEGRKVTSQRSDSITLTVAALPKATLIMKPKWRLLYNGETITMRCEVDSYSNWTYFWYRDHNQTATSLSKEYSVNITGAAGSHQGQYRCEGRLEGRNVTSQRSDSITLTVAVLSLMTRLGSPKDVLTLQPNWPLFFTGETVSLRCSGRPFKHHGFSWVRIESNIFVTKHISQENIYTIAPVTEAHSGVYRCSGESESDPVRLNVSALPKATLTVEPKWHPLYNEETITLRCEVESYSNWTYSWYKDQAQMAVSQTAGQSVTGNRLTIPGAAGSDQGQYWCEGRLEGRKVTSQRSDSITLTFAALPKATLTVEPKWRPLYNGETVTLSCEVESYSNWTYSWYKDQAQMAVSQTAGHSVTGNTLTIPGAAGSDQGQYWCEGRLEERNVTSQRSDSINLTVAALPKATLTVEPKWRPLYNGETVTLRCEVDYYSSWTYSWYKDQPHMAVSQTAGHSVTGNRLTIPWTAGSDQGQYWCEGRLEERKVTSQRSDSINLTVAGESQPKATLTVEPKCRPLYNGETVTLRCEVESYSNWTYSWYKDQAQMAVSQTAYHSVTGNRLTIPGSAGSDQGQYWCEGRLEGRKVTSQRSDSINLTVAALPKPTLTVEPKWCPLYNGETITLRCEVESYSNWTYSWYKDQAQMAVSQTAGHSVTGNRLTIPGAAGSDQGQYWCEGRLEGRKVTSQHSDSITLTVALPKATLTVEPKWRPLYNGETVTLSCEVESYSNWIYSWYKDQAQMAVSQTAGQSVTGNTLTIPGAAGSDQGQYWCEGRLEGRNVTSQRSDSITLTVALPKATLIVKSKWRPLYNGETVTLRCEVDSYSKWTHFWYRDHNQIATSLTKEYSVNITGAAGSDQGQYWCEGRLEGSNVTSQRSDSITLTVAGRLVFGLGAAPLLLASIILCVKWCRRPGSPNEAAVKYTEENVEVDL
ncbi:basement membrane-specific heparan sulfate proteoglycan core protein-like [Anguilla rostrata]|uniref:basement membrane-specific heparan sulfate proteoglycan core protein-like n=1 Tax=Anguilla rostrata TaxID=7938 RepID=UPI0030D4DCE4